MILYLIMMWIESGEDGHPFDWTDPAVRLLPTIEFFIEIAILSAYIVLKIFY